MSQEQRTGRIGYWPLRTDSEDRSGRDQHGIAHGVGFDDSAVFDGVSSYIELPDISETDGSRPFTLSLEFEVNDGHGYFPGGLASRYSEATMEGWHLSVLSQAGVTSSQSNWRNLQFGWSTGKSPIQWKDWGSPGNGRYICSMCVYNDSLYAGIFDDAQDNRGHVYRLDKDGRWIDCGNPDNSNSVWSMAEYNGKLYVGTMRYRAAGSALPESPNQEAGGNIYRYEGGRTWTLFGRLPVEGNDSVGALTVYDGKLIAMSFYPHGIFAFGEDGSCESLGAPGPEGKTRTMTLSPYQGNLYVGCNQKQGVSRRTLREPWEDSGTVTNCDQVYCFSVFHNELLTGIWPEARMFRYEDGEFWSDYGLMGSEKEVMGIAVFNGKLYGGTLPGGHVYRYTGEHQWELIGVLEQPDPHILYRRVWTMAVFNGQLFAGTLPGGKVWSLTHDPLATSDTSLSPGWHRATATYDQERLRLYVDGDLVSTVTIPPQAVDESGRAAELSVRSLPFVLGKGPQCHFSGRIREVQLFDRALGENEIG
ncbi:LamG-like jellyroll fold domain-containing protein [Cohnella soli]|uniref:LamG-like jellyroll fold domain-containing protein n=1 Tax=Cohnella soli TaxID=425005 RepID=A0ABW0HV68_9BACL